MGFIATFGGCVRDSGVATAAVERGIEIFPGKCGETAEPLRDNCLKLGKVPQGSYIEQPFCIRNGTAAVLHLTGFSSSCECLTLDGLPVAIPSEESRSLKVRIDLTDERAFVGELEICTLLFVEKAQPIPVKSRFAVRGKEVK